MSGKRAKRYLQREHLLALRRPALEYSSAARRPDRRPCQREAPRIGGRFGTEKISRLVDADQMPAAVAADHLLFIRSGSLHAQALDLQKRELGQRQVLVVRGSAGVLFSASTSGAIVYRSRLAPAKQQFIWMNRTGGEITRFGEASIGGNSPSLSPDGRLVAMGRTVDGNLDIWLLDARGGTIRLTSAPAIDNSPVWSPDGRRIAFESYADGRTATSIRRPPTALRTRSCYSRRRIRNSPPTGRETAGSFSIMKAIPNLVWTCGPFR
ncbi:MAG: hypothetical protein FJW27_01625 [Acidimicrobiia bacterium]|nr:hypothetical protein [Acidimicrobiia bacterium]